MNEWPSLSDLGIAPDVAAKSPMVLISGRPDAEVARELRARLTELLRPVCDILNEARGRGLAVSFSTANDQVGNVVVGPITIARHY